MKTITIRLPDVEQAMLAEVQKVNKSYKRPAAGDTPERKKRISGDF